VSVKFVNYLSSDLTDWLGANDGHVSIYPWDWIVRHRKQPGVLLSQKEKDMRADP